MEYITETERLDERQVHFKVSKFGLLLIKNPIWPRFKIFSSIKGKILLPRARWQAFKTHVAFILSYRLHKNFETKGDLSYSTFFPPELKEICDLIEIRFIIGFLHFGLIYCILHHSYVNSAWSFDCIVQKNSFPHCRSYKATLPIRSQPATKLEPIKIV